MSTDRNYLVNVVTSRRVANPPASRGEQSRWHGMHDLIRVLANNMQAALEEADRNGQVLDCLTVSVVDKITETTSVTWELSAEFNYDLSAAA